MTQEEKAKHYDEAIKRAEKALEVFGTDKCEGARQIFSLFPELAESEDEKIRKAILNYLTKMWGNSQDDVCGVHVEDAIAWLKKQGEQKPTVIIPKFRVGDEIKTPNEESLTITKIDEKGYWSEDLFICRFDDADKWELVEQKDSVVDFKAEDWYVSKVDGKIYNAKFMEQNSCKKTTRRGEIEKAAFSTSGIIEQTDWFIKGAEWADEHPYCNWLEKQGEQQSVNYDSNEGERIKETLIDYFKTYKKQEECGIKTFFGIPTDDIISWLKNQSEQKPAWSEEDKDFMYDTLSNLTELKDRYGEGYGNVGGCIDWLKSLKQRIQHL